MQNSANTIDSLHSDSTQITRLANGRFRAINASNPSIPAVEGSSEREALDLMRDASQKVVVERDLRPESTRK